MLHFRFENIEALVDQPGKDQVVILDEIASFDYGKFVRIPDIEENKIELRDPSDTEQDKPTFSPPLYDLPFLRKKQN
ncbi:MAG: hypothetical protein WCO44_05585 [Bacteroidota bacterium]